MSEKGAMVIYQTVIAMDNWTMPKTPGFDTTMMSQAVFHFIWSFSEDLSLLSWMTDCKRWNRRREMGDMFAKAGSSTEPAPLSMPKLENYSKLASANITDPMTEMISFPQILFGQVSGK